MNADLLNGLYSLRRYAETLKDRADEERRLTVATRLASIALEAGEAIEIYERANPLPETVGNGATARELGV